MGREVKRVPLDFVWPMREVWSGYRMPKDLNVLPCKTCGETGYSPEARAIAETFYEHQIGGPDARRLAWHDKIGQAEVDNLVEKGRLRVWRDGKWHQEPRTAAEVNAEQHQRGLVSHDAINRMILVEFRCERLGIQSRCPHCAGEGHLFHDEAHRQAHEAWERSEPPHGDGWQMWEDTSEGSPISPVFQTPEALARWLADTHASAFGSDTATYAEWLRMIVGTGWAPSMVLSGGVLQSGVTSAALREAGHE